MIPDLDDGRCPRPLGPSPFPLGAVRSGPQGWTIPVDDGDRRPRPLDPSPFPPRSVRSGPQGWTIPIADNRPPDPFPAFERLMVQPLSTRTVQSGTAYVMERTPQGSVW